MLVWIANRLVEYYPGFNTFSCLTFRAIISLFTSFCISVWIGPSAITYLKKVACGQVVRNEHLRSRIDKFGIPTMGGIIILPAVIFSVLLWDFPFNLYVWCVLTILVSYGVIGFFDDYQKIVRESTRGLSASLKYFWMSVFSLGISSILYFINRNTTATCLFLPLFKDIIPQTWLFYITLSYFVIVGAGNAVNLTDGLDGLAIVPIVLVSGAFSLIAWITGNITFSHYLHIPYLHYASELTIVCTAIVGAGLGFLWFNTYPGQVFMGDMGSLSLGGALGVVAVLLRQEFLLVIMGGLFVIEALSVIIQVISFKIRGQRIFLMAPIHHHFELKGWPEPRITVRFWIISSILVLVGLSIIKIR